MIQHQVLVIGGIHHNILGVIRSLGFARIPDIKVILVGKEPDFVSRSKYIKKRNIVKIASDNLLLGALFKIGREAQEKPIVICSSDTSISIIDQNYDELSKFFILPNAQNKQGEINRLMSKSVQCQIAEQCGLNVPQSICTNDATNLEKWNIFPCIIKPSESINGSKSDIKICHTPDELVCATKEFKGNEFQIQQFIEKDSEFQLIGCSLNHGKDVTIPGYTSIIRQPDNTNTGYLQYKGIDSFISDSFLTKVKKFLQTTGYEGLFSVEFLRDKKGQDYFLEINMRNDGNSFCVTVAGINLPCLWYQNGTGTQVTGDTSKVRPVYFMPEIEDLREAVHQKVGLFTWLMQFLNTEAHAVFYFKDPAPFIYRLFAEFKRIFIKKLKH